MNIVEGFIVFILFVGIKNPCPDHFFTRIDILQARDVTYADLIFELTPLISNPCHNHNLDYCLALCHASSQVVVIIKEVICIKQERTFCLSFILYIFRMSMIFLSVLYL